MSQNLKFFQRRGLRRTLVAAAALTTVAGASMIFSPLVPASGEPAALSSTECSRVTRIYAALGQALSPHDTVLDIAQAALDEMNPKTLQNIVGQDRVNLRARPGEQNAAPDKMPARLQTSIARCSNVDLPELRTPGQFIGHPAIQQFPGRKRTTIAEGELRLTHHVRKDAEEPGSASCVSAQLSDSLSGGGCLPEPSSDGDVIFVQGPVICSEPHEPTEFETADPPDCSRPEGVSGMWLKPLKRGSKLAPPARMQASKAKSETYIDLPETDVTVWVGFSEANHHH